jgi:hypothetical protein
VRRADSNFASHGLQLFPQCHFGFNVGRKNKQTLERKKSRFWIVGFSDKWFTLVTSIENFSLSRGHDF